MTEKLQIRDNPQDVSVKYLYVKKWIYDEAADNEKFQGEPRSNTVYRSIYNKKTNSYRLFLSDTDAMYVPQLISHPDVQATYELVELTKNNILDLHLSEEELDKIITWSESKEMNNEHPVVTSINNAIEQHQHEQAERMAWIVEAMSDLDNVNSIHFGIMIELAAYLVEYNVLRHEDPHDLALDEDHGTGVNISRAQSYLRKYVGKDKKTNDEREDVFTAIYHLITEVERRELNELDA